MGLTSSINRQRTVLRSQTKVLIGCCRTRTRAMGDGGDKVMVKESDGAKHSIHVVVLGECRGQLVVFQDFVALGDLSLYSNSILFDRSALL